MLDIKITTQPVKLVRAEQSGDWWLWKDGMISACVVENTYPPDSELMIAIHELIEAWLCRRNGVSEQAVVDFDLMFEEERRSGHHGNSDEPGDDPRSPYRNEHQAATHVERAVGSALGVSWQEHERLVTESAKTPGEAQHQLPLQTSSGPQHPAESSDSNPPGNP